MIDPNRFRLMFGPIASKEDAHGDNNIERIIWAIKKLTEEQRERLARRLAEMDNR